MYSDCETCGLLNHCKELKEHGLTRSDYIDMFGEPCVIVCVHECRPITIINIVQCISSSAK